MITILLFNDADLGSISSSVPHFGNVGVAISAFQIKIIIRFIPPSTQEGSRTAAADPDNTGRGYNDIIGDLGDHSVPEGWVQRPKFNEKGDVPGPPVQWQKPEDPDNAQPAMVMSLPTPPTPRISSSIIVTTSAAPLILPMPRPTSPSLMLICPMASFWLTSIHLQKKCRISSMVRNSTKRRDCIIMGRDI